MSIPTRVLPNIVRRHTIRPGGDAAVILTETLQGTGVVRAPAFTLTSSTPTGILSVLRGQGVEWLFDSTITPWRILLWTGSGDPRAAPVGIEVFATPPGIQQNASSFTVTWTDVTYGTVVVTGTLDTTTGKLSLGIVVTLGATIIAAGYKLWGVDFPYLRITPQRHGQKDAMQIVTGQFGGQLFHGVCSEINLSIYGLGVTAPTRGESAYPVETTENQLLTGGGFYYLYDRDISAGLMIRTKDTLGRKIDYKYKGTGTAVDVWVRHYPEDNLADTAAFTVPYGIELHPMTGLATAAATKYREFLQAEAHPGLVRGKIWQATTGAFPTQARDAKWVFYANLAATDAADRATSIANILADCTRASTFYGGGIVVWLYNWQKNSGAASFRWPDVTPAPADVKTLLASLTALGVTVILYTYPFAWDPTSVWYVATNPATSVVLDVGQTSKVIETSPRTLYSGQAGNSTARSLETTLVGDQFTDLVAANVAGMYFDALGGSQRFDFRTALTAAQKGPGSTYWVQGLRTYMADIIAAATVLHGGFVSATEFPDELLADKVNFFGHRVSDTVSLLAHYPIMKTILGEYASFMDFSCVSSIDPALSTAQLELGNVLNRWLLARNFTQGISPSWFELFTTKMPWFITSNEANYSKWVSYVSPLNDFWKLCVNTMDSSLGATRKYVRGRRLQPLEDSLSHYLEARPFAFMFLDYVASLSIPGPLPSEVWVTDEEIGQPVGILIANPFETDRTVRIKMDSINYAPYMGGERYLAKNVGGVRTKIANVTGFVDQTVTITAKTVAVYELVTTEPTA